MSLAHDTGGDRESTPDGTSARTGACVCVVCLDVLCAMCICACVGMCVRVCVCVLKVCVCVGVCSIPFVTVARTAGARNCNGLYTEVYTLSTSDPPREPLVTNQLLLWMHMTCGDVRNS